MTKENKYRLIAALVSLLSFVAVVVWLVVTRLTFSPSEGTEWPPVDGDELLLADEYVEIEIEEIPVVPSAGGDSQPNEGAAPPPPDAQDIVDAGKPGDEITPIVTSPEPSTLQSAPREPRKPTGPSQAELEAQAREKRQKDASAEANNRVKFGTTPAATGSGDGTSATGSGASQQKGSYSGSGSGSVNGRGVSVSGGISCNSPGTVTVRISVDPSGKVTTAEIIQPTTIADSNVREKCRQRALAAKVTPAPDKTTVERGRITFIFK